jgi:hypothetical protein
MTTPHHPDPNTQGEERTPRTENRVVIHGTEEIWGPLIRQPAPAARVARILHNSATDLWDLCTMTDTDQMQDEARAIAGRILAACPADR